MADGGVDTQPPDDNIFHLKIPSVKPSTDEEMGTQPPEEPEFYTGSLSVKPSTEEEMGTQPPEEPEFYLKIPSAKSSSVEDESDDESVDSQKTVDLGQNEQNHKKTEPKITATAVINDEPDSKTGEVTKRKVIICDYLYEGQKKKTAFYQSSGSSHGTSALLKNTFFPFYGEDKNGHLIKAPELVHDSYLNVPKWKSQLRASPFFLPRTIIQYFNNYSEMQISACLGEGWWSTPTGENAVHAVAQHKWDGEKYNKVRATCEITEDKLKGKQITLHPKTREINSFLLDNGALNKSKRKLSFTKKGGKKMTHKKNEKSLSNKRTKRTKSNKRNKRRTIKRRR